MIVAPERAFALVGGRYKSKRLLRSRLALCLAGMMRWMAPFHGIDVPKGCQYDTDEGATHERD